jgi:hypothetical protein
MWHIHAMGYYSVIKRNEEMILATTWINFGSIRLREKKPVIRNHISHDTILMKYTKKENLEKQK